MKRRRSEAITQLRKAGSPYAKIAALRTFKAGQKGSTFPWADTAAALHGHTGCRWLASEIAIIGASSPFSLAYTKKPDATAFGTRSHPSELLAQARANNRNADWWRQQRDALDDDLAQAEWALALWCAASGPVVSGLLPLLETVLSQLAASRRSTVLRAADQVARYGWLKNRPVTTAAADPELATLNRLRTSAPVAIERHGAVSARRDNPARSSLLSVARAEMWLKVDAKPAYR